MAEHSPDRQARAAAVECLHAVLLWMIGEALHSRRRLQAFLATFASDAGSSTPLRPASSLRRALPARWALSWYACTVMRSTLVQVCATYMSACAIPNLTRRARAGTNAKRARAREEKDFAARPTRFHALLRRLLPAALRLAAAAEPVARGLFGELVPALVHWLTRSARTCARPHAPPPPLSSCRTATEQGCFQAIHDTFTIAMAAKQSHMHGW
jgi:hypothetical protein